MTGKISKLVFQYCLHAFVETQSGTDPAQAQDSGSPPLAGYTSLRVMVTDLPLNQLQALRERLKKSEEDPAKEDFTVVWIASLATVTVLLIVVLTGVVVKCRKDNKVFLHCEVFRI